MLRSSILLAAGVAGALVGLLSKPKKTPTRAAPHFRIRRTKSELGYTFWILQGFAKHKCFVLCDTWQEAIDEANLRLHHPVREMVSPAESLPEQRILATASH
jgi:hypothetical protein